MGKRTEVAARKSPFGRRAVEGVVSSETNRAKTNRTKETITNLFELQRWPRLKRVRDGSQSLRL